MIGFFGVVFFLIFYFLLTSPYILVAMVIEKFNPKLVQQISLNMIKRGGRIVNKIIGVKMTVIGHENVPENEPVLYVGNHRSYFDVVVGYPLVEGLCGFIAKKQIEKVPSLRVWMRKLHCLFLDRDNLREGMRIIKEGVRMVKEDGISVWICPEGTRSHEKEMLPFKEGSFKIAEMSGCPVVPVAITHSDEILELHFPWIRSADVTIEFGEPVETVELDRAGKKALPGTVQEIIRRMYEANY